MTATVAADTKPRYSVPRQPNRQRVAAPSRLSRDQVSGRLHHALVSVSRGLLQYASQCAPWTPVGEAHRSASIRRLAVAQQDSIQRLCDLLIERRAIVDWGVFPFEYTSYNFVSLDFLLPKITDYQTELVRALEIVRDELSHDPRATEVLDRVVQTERGILNELALTDSVQAVPVSITCRPSQEFRQLPMAGEASAV